MTNNVQDPTGKTGPLGSVSGVQARLQYRGGLNGPTYRRWALFYSGTNNEVFPGESFNSPAEAKRFFRAQNIKMAKKEVEQCQ